MARIFAFCFLLLAASASAFAADARSRFVEKHCAECHDPEMKEGGLDLTALSFNPTAGTNFAAWVKVFDRVKSGEMPPTKKPRPEPGELKAFLKSLETPLLAADRARVEKEGRATQRRLNRYEYEETLRDLLALPWLEVKEFLPEDTEAHGFNKIGDALDVSHVQMARYLTAADYALRQAVLPQIQRPETTTNRYYAMEQGSFYGAINLEGPMNRRVFPLIGGVLQTNLMGKTTPRRRPVTTNQMLRDMEAMSVVVSTYEPTEIRFNAFRAPQSGKYRLTFSAYSVWLNEKWTASSKGRRDEPVTIYAETPPRVQRKLGSFDVSNEPTVRSMEAWLLAGETIRPDAARFFRSRPPDFRNPLQEPDGSPALAFQWMQVEGPLIEEWPPAGHTLLFGSLPVRDLTNAPPAPRRRDARDPAPFRLEVVSENPERDAETLLRNFMERACRHPARAEDVQRFLGVIRKALAAGHSFTDAMIAGYTGVLSSPDFLYLHEQPGKLEDLALADRLAYFLWNSPPDAELLDLAKQGKLRRPSVLRKQTERLLNDPKSKRFVAAFLDYWLDLRTIAGTAPDTELYPDYQLDDLLVESMIDESQLFFSELLRRDLPARNLVSSDFAMLNERLAKLYGIEGVSGVHLRPVALKPDSLRGGLLTQASVLKVTSNGSTTSPVKRGAWIMTRLLGQPPPPPPETVPAVEPDIRGATTIREQLDKHRSEASCAACHRKIDPAGFALESFDVMGGWRDRYRSLGEGEPVKGSGHNGILYRFRLAQAVDSSGDLPGGGPFKDVRELKQLLLKNEAQIARNFAQQLAVFATGAPIRFSDRPKIEKILSRSEKSGYGARTLVHELVQSDLFLSK